MLRALEVAREKLTRWGIHNTTMIMVLYAMLESGYDYMKAVRAYAAHKGCEPETLLLEMDEAAREHTRAGAYTVIRWCYREAINED